MKKISIDPGKYVLAVSGGVDSMVLLDMLQGRSGIELIVAHYDHGIRSDSAEDRTLVQQKAADYGLPFEFAEGRLGASVNEATARGARYEFLESVRQKHDAQAIVTAHHQDDVIETALLNLLRGTNRRGLTSLKSTETVIRPLLSCTKSELIAYATSHNLAWREDSTNQDETYLRNFVRHSLVSKLSSEQKSSFVTLLRNTEGTNTELDTLLAAELNLLLTPEGLRRTLFAGLDHALSKEILALWLRNSGLREYDAALLERLVVAAKTARAGTQFDIMNGTVLRISKHYLALYNRKR